jgi:cysteine desulfurase
MQRIDLDHNSGTLPDPRVLARFVDVEGQGLANPSSLHESGRRARAVLEEARREAAEALGTDPDEVVFVSGGTEGNNLAVRGLGDPTLPVLLAPLEHPSVLEPAKARGIVAWNVDRGGRAIVTPPEREVGLVTLVHAQGELGTLQPIAAAAELARGLGVPFHVDAAQTLGRVPVEAALAAADTVSFATHKAGGLRGMSLFVSRRHAGPTLRPLLLGGGQEGGLRAGTPSVALAAATALAVTLAVRECPARAEAMRRARDAFVARLPTDSARVLTTEPALPNTVLVLCDVPDGRAILPALDLLGVAASQGAACSSGASRPPAALEALGFTEDEARRAVALLVLARDENRERPARRRTGARILDTYESSRASLNSDPDRGPRSCQGEHSTTPRQARMKS